MIVLDTNIVSAMMRSPVDEPVVAWLGRRADDVLAITVVTVMEIRHGLDRLPDGRRRSSLEARFEEIVSSSSGFDVLDFDEPSARRAGAFLAVRDSVGRPAQEADMMIAGIVASVGATLATRDVGDYVGLAIPIETPYQDGSKEGA